MSDVISEESILDLLKDDSKFSAKIAELTRARSQLDQMRKDANAALSDLTRQKTETTNFVNGKKAELSQKQKEHDAAAAEAATRLELGRTQMAEVQRIKAENNAAAARLDGRERELAKREKMIGDAQVTMAAQVEEIAKARDLIRRQQDHMAKLPKA